MHPAPADPSAPLDPPSNAPPATPAARVRLSLPGGEPVLGPYGGHAVQRADGSWVLRSRDPLRPYGRAITEPLLRWAAERPDQVYLAERDPASGAWRELRYAQALQQALSVGQALLDRGLSAERPLMILSGNSLAHAVLMLGALHVGVPVAPVSPASSLLPEALDKLHHAVRLLTPGLVFAEDGAAHGRAIAAAVPAATELVLGRGPAPDGRAATPLAALLDTAPTPAVAAAHAAVQGDSIAKFLFTSGSTQLPKAVINTHRMLCSNMQMYRQTYPFLEVERQVLVDWLPWHHTAGGNVDFNLVLTHGGTLYIDDGKPTEAGMAATLRNLREIAPTQYITVPKGLDALSRALEADAALRQRFFSRLRLVFPAGAALPPAVLQRLHALAEATLGERVPVTMGLGMTETAPAAMSAHLPDWQAGVVGLPNPGVTLRLVPTGEGPGAKLEVRYAGPNVTPGYWRNPALTAAAFDDQGYFRSGDAVRFIDPAHPAAGLAYDGRIAEDFKLSTGTFVSVGALRAAVLSAGAPWILDVVVTGHGRDAPGLLVFLQPDAARLAGLPSDAPAAQVIAHPAVRGWLQALLQRLGAQAGGSSHRLSRALLQAEPASTAAGELTDKGSLNQRAVLARRAAEVERLHAEPPAPDVVCLSPAPAKAAL